MRVLDVFTSLTAELTLRKKQYAYYREALLSFDDETRLPKVIQNKIHTLCPHGVEWKTLGEVAEIGTGSSNAKEGLKEGLYPFFFMFSKTFTNK